MDMDARGEDRMAKAGAQLSGKGNIANLEPKDADKIAPARGREKAASSVA
jgi:hypothetical protein